ncbi:CDP-alcohol phosphatidyltransferase family protein [Halococcus thailandensis]|uniref:CDP-diacylglycerol-glycerol-3-phosphate 3-phosphatidyltransferase n=1 Tax=Halococcus thailandensis JCM 13552 TaxID=1227457 RepID=M0N446_9EURY|nr:CDP-alcohol phosphatidyltransferase family protein [Halococcus thailandensis]EMA51460.1 CDP-diacylglycerol-glycerol-3-phosphate 3-phosphatidyltransferase [Halococcus thailandensis JCM 13552]
MTLDQYRSLADRLLEPFVGLAARAGLTPNGVSALAFVLAGAAGVAYALAGGESLWYLVGAVLVGLNGALDLLDGALARRLNTASPAGDLLDHVLDRYADIVLVVGLAIGIERMLLGIVAVTGVLMTSYLGTQAQAVGLDRVYGGLLGRADRLALIGIVTAIAAFVAPSLFDVGLVGWLLVVLAVVGHLTALQRLSHAWNALSPGR